MKKDHVIPCPECGKLHYRNADEIDTFIDCDCGKTFYTYSMDGMMILLSEGDACNEAIARSLRHLVVASGRGENIPVYLLQEPCELYDGMDLDSQAEAILSEYEEAAFGECLIQRAHIDAIMEILQSGSDAEVKKSKDKVNVIKNLRQNMMKAPKKHRTMPIANQIYMHGGFSDTGILRVRQMM